ncbi:uncharacterized protein TM35_000301280 [Trypanosoma theileri]|uniref:Uncharacterized protein n=1 Tax=Trypanosoma theileri TaxID=67003 RepID=A0A1X0NNL4_9TRYP|nr:uncharacterized protein TM35_000301280 [Trypanosoma theileri]ORC86088.1 hypothetical protein TM35_000301280 [Trypanosoma theileri]
MYDLNVSGATQPPPQRSSDNRVEHKKSEFIPSTTYNLYDERNPKRHQGSSSSEHGVSEEGIHPSSKDTFNNNECGTNTTKHMRNQNTQSQLQSQQQQGKQIQEGQEPPYKQQQEQEEEEKEIERKPSLVVSSGVRGPHTPLFSSPSPVAAQMEVFTGPVVHDIIMQTRLNFQAPPKLTLQTQTQPTRPCLTPPNKCNHSHRKGNEMTPPSAVFSMSPGGVTSLSTSLHQGSVASFNSTPRSPEPSWLKLGEKVHHHGHISKLDKVVRQTPLLSLPRENHTDFSNGDISPVTSFPVSLINYRSPVARKHPTPTGNETSNLFGTPFQQQLQLQQQLQQQQEKQELAQLSPSSLIKKPFSPKKDDTWGNNGVQRQQQQQQQTLLQVSTSSTNKSSGSSNRCSALNSTSTYSNGRLANLSTSIAGGGSGSVSLPAISIPSGTCIPLKTVRNGKNNGVNHVEKSPGPPWSLSMRNGFSESGLGISVPFSPRGEMGSIRSPHRKQQPQQDTTNRSVQELLVQEIVTQLRPK